MLKCCLLGPQSLTRASNGLGLRGLLPILALTICGASTSLRAADRLENALDAAGDNRAEIQRAIDDAPAEQREAMQWLVERMPANDLQNLSADYLLENCRLAFAARDAAPWSDQVPEAIFLDAVLPYAVINERRDDWRAEFRKRFAPLVKDAKTPGEAAVILNQNIFKIVGVKYSTRRPKADQSGLESIDAGLASCSGLSVLLIEACRAVGVPARFAGVALWSDGSGNHSWVEVYDDGQWKFTGAAEPTGNALNRGWFTGRVQGAVGDDYRRAVWATTWRNSPAHFPLVWEPRNQSVRAVNVTDRYTQSKQDIPAGKGRLYVRCRDANTNQRVVASVSAFLDDEQIASGKTRDESFDANDHLEWILPLDSELKIRVELGDTSEEKSVRFSEDEQLVELTLTAVETTEPEADKADPESKTSGLSQSAANAAIAKLWDAHTQRVREERAAEVEARKLKIGDLEMPFWYKVYGEPKAGQGRSLFISMHGGGGAPPRVNDQQWENQKRLYQPEEGVYVAPRAPTNTWNLWHQGHIDDFFDRLIEDLIVLENVDPDRVYIMGYSAGGDGVYQLAPRMADRLAAAAMMAGHPNETRPDGLRNLPFTLHMGGNDGAYSRNAKAEQWKNMLADLAAEDEGGYPHKVVIHEGKGHWMDRQDAVAVPWMSQYDRNLRPKRIVWLQDDRVHDRFYWLKVNQPKAREKTVVERDGNVVRILEGAENGLHIRVDDTMFDLDKPITVYRGDEVVFEDVVPRSLDVIKQTLAERGDRQGIFTGEIVVPAAK